MEETEERETTDNPDACEVFFKLIYYLNDDKKKEGNLPLLNFNEKSDMISYNEITYSFYLFLKNLEQIRNTPNDSYTESSRINSEFYDLKPIYINFEYIRYSDGEGWMLLEEDDVIQLGDRSDELNIDDLEIMIKASIVKDKKLKIKKMYQDIDNEIKNIYERLSPNNKNNSTPDVPLNLIVLTANPLMDNERELRTMNDFHIITSKIYNLFKDQDFLKYTEFFPLTVNKLIEILSDKNKTPVILHLICKSTYNDEVPNLIFEEDMKNYNLEFIGKNELDKIFNFKKFKNMEDNIKKITLIISTPLAEDVYDLFKDYGFKNLIVQHTTLADVDFIADFNYQFYKDLIIYSDKTINEVFNNAFNINIDENNRPVFCCCLHKHKNSCGFLKNLNNELYNDNNNKNDNKENNNNDIYKINVDELKDSLPHFYHLFYHCNCIKFYDKYSRLDINTKELEKIGQNLENDFCFHRTVCHLGFNNIKINKKAKTMLKNEKGEIIYFYNYCCCKKNPGGHNNIDLFKKDFSNIEKNNKINFRIAETLIEGKFNPNYDKMELLVGKNKIVLDVIKFFDSQDNSLNIYSDKMENLKILGNIIIEYYKEKNYDLYNPNKEDTEEENFPEKNKDEIIKRIISDPCLTNSDKYNMEENNNLNHIKSLPEISSTSKRKKFDFEEIDLNDNEIKILIDDFKFKDINNNKIFFVYVNDDKLVNKISNKINKIIFFQETEDPKNNEPKSIFFKEPTLKSEDYYMKEKEKVCPNEYIKFQKYNVLINNWRKK